MTPPLGETQQTYKPPIGFLDTAITKLADDPEFVAEGLAMKFAEQIARAMKSQGVTKAELGRRLGTSRAYTTRILDAPPNLTLLSMAKVTLALGLNLRIDVAGADVEVETPGAPELGSPVLETIQARPKDRAAATS